MNKEKKYVWYEQVQIEYCLKNGKYIIGASHSSVYKYSNLPPYTKEVKELSWQDLKQLTFLCHIGRTLFKGREYISASWDYGSIYKDDLEKAILVKEVHIIDLDNERTDRLQHNLSFNEYSELIFDREQELKKLLEKEKANDK